MARLLSYALENKNKYTLCLEWYYKYTFLSRLLTNILLLVYKVKTSTLIGQTPFIRLSGKYKSRLWLKSYRKNSTLSRLLANKYVQYKLILFFQYFFPYSFTTVNSWYAVTLILTELFWAWHSLPPFVRWFCSWITCRIQDYYLCKMKVRKSLKVIYP